MSKTITTRLERRVEADPSGMTVTDTTDGQSIMVALTRAQAGELAAALDPERDFSGVDWKVMYDQARRERDAAVYAYDKADRERDEWKSRAEAAEQERDEWESLYLEATFRGAIPIARAEAAEARTAPAVSRADVAEALSRCINPEMWNVTFPSVVNEVCDLFGVEVGQATDPLLDKAQEFAALADWELTDREAELLHTVARHVLGQEEPHVDQ